MKFWRIFFVSILSLAAIFFSSAICEARHLKLYTYDLADVDTGILTYTFDHVSGSKEGIAKGNPTLNELELEYAFTKHWMQSLYIDYDYASTIDGNPEINEVSSVKTEFNFNFFEKGEKFVDSRFNIELAKAINNKIDAYGNRYKADTIEFRFIFEKNFEWLTIVFGPMLVKDISGPGELGGLNYGYANAIQMDFTDRVRFSLEFYGFMGEGKDLRFANRQSHTIVPNLDIAVTKNITFSVGAGFGLTRVSDDFTFRSAIAYSFEKFW